MSTHKEIPITETQITCKNCGYSRKEKDLNKFGDHAEFDIICNVCGNEGCTKCIAQDSFYVHDEKYHRHEKCPWTQSLIDLRDETERRVREKIYRERDSRYELGGEFNCGRDCS
ncbi:hypothetical protein KAT92_06430 [Candidatus Babeliales bacterium]|nr:hypothetical protein [Candidatus Babeliales bacterium]